MKAPSGFLPEARRKGIISKEADGELLIYDLERDKAHCLNAPAATIWRLCDGRNSITEITASLATEAGATVYEDVVWLALADLRRLHLLEETGSDKQKFQLPETILGMSRREAVRRIGIGAVALPIVISITAPTAQANVSCKALGVPCATSAECCSTLCDTGNTDVCI